MSESPAESSSARTDAVFEPLERSASRGQRLLLGYAFLGAPLAWGVHIGARYPLVPLACKRDAVWALHLVTAACFALALGAVIAAVVVYRRSDLLRARIGEVARERMRYMAFGGIALGVSFVAVICAELLPALMQDPCLHVTQG